MADNKTKSFAVPYDGNSAEFDILPEHGSLDLECFYNYIADGDGSSNSLSFRITTALNKISQICSEMHNNFKTVFLSESLYRISILKILIDLGLKNENHIAVIARIIEISAYNRDVTLEQAIKILANRLGATESAINHIIDKNFNVYDSEFFARISAITRSQPFTAKDALCDLSVCIRKNYVIGGMFRA